jgi:enamine deaminase RidA (YjgF/YER057c/UK114 family)
VKDPMKLTVTDWHNHEISFLIAEGDPGISDTAEQTRDIFRRLNEALQTQGLSLDDTIRTRLWARDRPIRDLSSKVRVEVLIGAARSASSSFISLSYFESNAGVGIELWAMRPIGSNSQKKLVEYEPAIVPLRYLERDGLVVVSGMTSILPGLREQVQEILGNVTAALTHAGVEWTQVLKLSAILHRSQTPADLRAALSQLLPGKPAEIELALADGYSTEGKLVEIEVTAAR